MAKIILCRGIQGSGKTTWAKQWVLEDPEHMEILEATNRKDDYGYSVYQDADLEHVVGATYNGYEGILHQQHYLE